MERLNSILGRTMPRRQYEAPSAPGNTARGPRQSSSSQHTAKIPAASNVPPTTRRPLPEQTARLGGKQLPAANQQRSSAPLPPQAYLRNAQAAQNRASRDAYAQRARTTQEYPQYEEQPVSRPPYTHQPSVDAVPSPYQQRPRPRQDVQRMQPTQPVRPMPSLPPDNYYHTDDHGPALPADVYYDDQDLEEDDDVGTAMLYGDYLDDEEEMDEYFEDEEVPAYQREREFISEPQLPAPRSSYPQLSSEPPALPPASVRARPTRDLRPVVYTQQSSPQQLQAPPQARAQEMTRYHRTTQPLRPQMLAKVQRDLTPEPPLPQQPQPVARHIGLREQSGAPERFATIPTSSMGRTPEKRVCPRCRGAGYLRLDVPFGHPNFGKPIACECKEAERKEKRRQQLRDMSNLDAHQSQTFATFNPRVPGVKEAHDVSMAYAQNPDGWLLLIGPNGCGKTHLAAAIANQSLDSGSVVLFSVVPDLLDHLRAAFAPTATELYDQLFAKMREAEVLVLDDMGSQQSSPWANEKLFQLLNYRYNLGMPTVITANPRGLQGIDERIRSRLADVNLVRCVNLDRSRDYRPNRPRRRD